MAGETRAMILRATETGQGAPLVLLHGLFGRSGNFGVVQRRMAARARVIALDLRNHGDSPHAADMRYPTMAEDVFETLAAMDALPATLMGHSMGGKVAMALALARPEAVTKLIVADIAPVPSPPRFRTVAAAMLALPDGLSRAQADAALSPAVPDVALRQFLLQNLRPGGGWRIGLAQIAADLPAIETWPGIDAPPYRGPTLFIVGGRSDFVREADRPVIRALFPHVRFVTLKNAGHWVHADDPQGFVAVLEAAVTPTRTS
jgi:pimeloyl-ACP methyl ester carboxylesterase